MKKHVDDIDDLELSIELFRSLMTSILGAFSQFRPDVGFISGLEKITAQFLLVFLPYQNFEDDDFTTVGVEFEIFKLLCTLT